VKANVVAEIGALLAVTSNRPALELILHGNLIANSSRMLESVSKSRPNSLFFEFGTIYRSLHVPSTLSAWNITGLSINLLTYGLRFEAILLAAIFDFVRHSEVRTLSISAKSFLVEMNSSMARNLGQSKVENIE
jgi:hypothetical protein